MYSIIDFTCRVFWGLQVISLRSINTSIYHTIRSLIHVINEDLCLCSWAFSIFSFDVLCNVEQHCGLVVYLMLYEIFLCVCVLGEGDRSDKKIHADIDESKVKAPNMFERAKEEFEAVIGAINQHKNSRFVCFFLSSDTLL